MGRKLVFEADLKTAGFEAGQRKVEEGSQRMISAAGHVQLAFRHFQRGNVQQGFTHIASSAGQVVSAFANVGRAAFDAGRKIMGALEGGLGILKSYVGYGTLIAGILGGIAVKMTVLDSAKFESEVGRAAIQSGATAEQRARMREAAMSVGIETPFGPLEAARAEKVEGQRGRNPEEIVNLLKAAAKLAVTGDMGLPQAAEALSQVMFQFGVPMEKATETALKLANATVATALGGDELFQAMTFAGSAAGVFKVNLTEVLAVLGTLRRSMDASTASTGLKNLMLFASALDSKSPKRLQGLGIDEEEAHAFDFMTGKAKSLLEVMRGIAETVKDKPQLAEKIFGTRSTLTFLTTLQQSDQFYVDLMARIDDTAKAQQQYNETIQLADNIFRRLETTAGAVLLSIGSKLRSTFGIDAGASALGGQLAELSRIIDAMPKENVREIVDSLGAGLIQAFGTAVSFLVEALIPVGVAFGKLIFAGISAAVTAIGSSSEFKSYLAEYAGMSAEERTAAGARLAKSAGTSQFGQGTVDELARQVATGGGDAANRVMLRRRAEALNDIMEQSSEQGSIAGPLLSGLRGAMANAQSQIVANPTYQAARRGVEAAQYARNPAMHDPPLSESQESFQAGFANHGILNVYGGFGSASERARPSRPSGTTSQERAQR